MPVPRRLIAAILALAGLLAAPPGYAAGGLPAPEVPACTAPPELIALGSGLPRTAARIAEGGTLTIVAMGCPRFSVLLCAHVWIDGAK